MKYVIDDIVTSFSARSSSHRSAWPKMQHCMAMEKFGPLNVELAFDNPDLVLNNIWLVSTPMEFKGEVFNLFGGYTKEVHDRIARLLKMDYSNIKPLDLPIPDIQKILRPRAEKSGWHFTDEEWNRISDAQNIPVLKHEDLLTRIDQVIIGDSHAIARYTPNSLVLRHDGLTLHGLVKRGVASYLPDMLFIPHLIIQVSNIDIRHHLLRQQNPGESIKKMIEELSEQCLYLQGIQHIGTYEVTAPYPIEYEERRIPKTGYYMGTPYYGTWEQRNDLCKVVTNTMKYYFDNVYEWPELWYQVDPKTYAENYMEKPGSVHLSPESYPWNLESNLPNFMDKGMSWEN